MLTMQLLAMCRMFIMNLAVENCILQFSVVDLTVDKNHVIFSVA